MLQTIGKAIQVLDLFSQDRPEWGVSEVARELDLPKSSTSELMSSLADHGLLCRASRGRYRLGWRLFELSQTLLDTTKFRTEARQVMEELVEHWKETVHLAVLDGAQAVYIEKMQPSPPVRILVTRAGARLPAHSSGVGKVLLVSCEWDKVAEILQDQGMPAFTPNTITELEELREELEQVRQQGYAYDDEETLIGLCCAAAPVYDSKGKTMAAISISVPAYRFEPARGEYTAAILEAAERISRSAGYEDKHPVYKEEWSMHSMEVERT